MIDELKLYRVDYSTSTLRIGTLRGTSETEVNRYVELVVGKDQAQVRNNYLNLHRSSKINSILEVKIKGHKISVERE